MEHVHRLVVKVACVVMPQRIVANHEVGHAGQEQEVEAQHQCVEPQAVRVPVNRPVVSVHGGGGEATLLIYNCVCRSTVHRNRICVCRSIKQFNCLCM